ncbi:hypothetical protein EGT51_03885 [Levilactobacillus suantsaiihabitans]|uniref:Uncharacterized protein n=1 Tax=Levilactobacillus suantsaiihabitans TaxID=2487722 RepID=A0A4Z0JE49_9LACO|nr:hypothetical protein EGT51_03885 [Levilactobacillus suantsaiihabitans]
MKQLFKHYYQDGFAKTNGLFKNYSKWFRRLFFGAGPILVIPLQLILAFLPESLPVLLLEVLGFAYLILTLSLFLVESIIHGVRYLRNK